MWIRLKTIFISLSVLVIMPAFGAAPWENPTWKALIHESSPLPHFGFYLSHSSDAKKEWIATLAAMNTPPKISLSSSLSASQEDSASQFHAQCVYRDRYEWIKINFSSFLITPAISCLDYESWKQTVKPSRIFLVYIEGEHSLNFHFFGDLLLKFEKKEITATPSFSYGVFAKLYPYPESPVQAFGQIRTQLVTLPWGQLSDHLPHFKTRRVWEWDLHLNPDEIDLILAHLWTLGQFDFKYSIFENNASNWIQEILSPVIPTAGHCGFLPWRVPFQSLVSFKTQIKNEQILSNQYSPSDDDLLNVLENNQNFEAKNLTVKFLKEDFTADPKNPSAALALETAIIKSKIKNGNQHPLTKRLRIQQAEWGLLPVKTPLPFVKNPIYFKKLSRVGITQGYLEKVGFYSAFRFHLLEHHRTDLDLKFLNLESRFYFKQNQLRMGQVQWFQWNDWKMGWISKLESRPVQVFQGREFRPVHELQVGYGRRLLSADLGHPFIRGALQWELGWIPSDSNKALRTGPVGLVLIPWAIHSKLELQLETQYFVNASGPGKSLLRNQIQIEWQMAKNHLLSAKIHNENGFVDSGINYQLLF